MSGQTKTLVKEKSKIFIINVTKPKSRLIFVVKNCGKVYSPEQIVKKIIDKLNNPSKKMFLKNGKIEVINESLNFTSPFKPKIIVLKNKEDKRYFFNKSVSISKDKENLFQFNNLEDRNKINIDNFCKFHFDYFQPYSSNTNNPDDIFTQIEFFRSHLNGSVKVSKHKFHPSFDCNKTHRSCDLSLTNKHQKWQQNPHICPGDYTEVYKATVRVKNGELNKSTQTRRKFSIFRCCFK